MGQNAEKQTIDENEFCGIYCRDASHLEIEPYSADPYTPAKFEEKKCHMGKPWIECLYGSAPRVGDGGQVCWKKKFGGEK